MQATVTSNGRVTFPKPIRDKLRLEPGDRLEFALAENGCSLLVTPVTVPVTRLKGMVPRPDARLSLEALDEAVAKAVTTPPRH